jgi:hypothetical protein
VELFAGVDSTTSTNESNLVTAEVTPAAEVTVTASACVDGLIEPLVSTTFKLRAFRLLDFTTVTIFSYLVTSGLIVTMPSTILETTLPEETNSKSHTYRPPVMFALVAAFIEMVITPFAAPVTVNEL